MAAEVVGAAAVEARATGATAVGVAGAVVSSRHASQSTELQWMSKLSSSEKSKKSK